MNKFDRYNNINKSEASAPKAALPPNLAKGTTLPKGYWDRFVPSGAMLDLDGRIVQFDSVDSHGKPYVNQVDLNTGSVILSSPAHLLSDAAMATTRFITGEPLRTFGDFREAYMISTGRPLEAQRENFGKRMKSIDNDNREAA